MCTKSGATYFLPPLSKQKPAMGTASMTTKTLAASSAARRSDLHLGCQMAGSLPSNDQHGDLGLCVNAFISDRRGWKHALMLGWGWGPLIVIAPGGSLRLSPYVVPPPARLAELLPR